MVNVTWKVKSELDLSESVSGLVHRWFFLRRGDRRSCCWWSRMCWWCSGLCWNSVQVAITNTAAQTEPYVKDKERIHTITFLLCSLSSVLKLCYKPKQDLSYLYTYLPSPPHAPFGATITSLQASVCVLYTSSFRGFPSWASISEKKSSDCKSTLWINHNSYRYCDKKQCSYILHLATVGLLRRYSHCVAEGLPTQQANWPPRPSGKKWQTKQWIPGQKLISIVCFSNIVMKKLTRTCQTFSFAPW